jgi:hypothetical protein
MFPSTGCRLGNVAPQHIAKSWPEDEIRETGPGAVLDQFKPLILSRLEHFSVVGDEDARSAAQLGLLIRRTQSGNRSCVGHSQH